MSEMSSASAARTGCAGRRASSSSYPSVPLAAPPTAMRGSVAAAGLAATAASLTGSYTMALAPESVRQYSTSSGLARQFSGVAIRPRNWQAQCRVAISMRFCSTTSRWSPRSRPRAERPAAAHWMRSYHCGVGQALLAVDDCQRVRAAFDALQECASKIEHDVLLQVMV